MDDKHKFIMDLVNHNMYIEDILYVYMNAYPEDFSSSRINRIIMKLQNDYLFDRINGLERGCAIAKERATYLEAYLEGKLYIDEETARACVPVQLENVRAILDACEEGKETKI